MRGEVIALDLETTGLDIETSDIIEIGIALCHHDDILQTYQTLVKPPNEIPFKATSITHITNAAVKDAPTIESLLQPMRDFIGQRPIIGHNIDFDINMLVRYDIAQTNPRIDTYELAAFLLPMAERYSLGSLIERFGLTLENAHRALDDAIASWQVYRQLWQLCFQLPMSILEEIIENAAEIDWQAKQPLEEVFQLRLEAGETRQPRAYFAHLYQAPPSTTSIPPLQPSDSPEEIDVHALSEWLQADGKVAQHLPDFEQREGQLAMLQMVGTAFNRDRHLILETPTGLGKNLAYLLPATQLALQNQTRVVIATHDRHTHEQLITQDIPFLQTQVGLPVRVAEVYGLNHYLCPRQLAWIRQRKASTKEELRVLAKVLVWLEQGGTGVKSEINLRSYNEQSAWNRFSAQEMSCQPALCQTRLGGACPLHRAQGHIESAHLILVRDSLLFSDLDNDPPIIPPYEYLIIDEAEHLEDTMTHTLGQHADKHGLLRRLGELGDLESGLFGQILTELRPAMPEARYAKIEAFVRDRAEALPDLLRRLIRFFDDLPQTLREILELGAEDFLGNQRITGDMRQHSSWQRPLRYWERCHEPLEALAESLEKLSSALTKAVAPESPQSPLAEQLAGQIHQSARHLQQVDQRLQEAILTPRPQTVYWIEVHLDNEQVAFHNAPVTIGKHLTEHFWEAKSSLVFISPTLRVNDSFDFIDDRWHSANQADHAYLESPFDFKQDVLLYLVNDIKEPNERQDYQLAFEQSLVDIASVTGGKMLVLFTSVAQLRETIQNIGPTLEKIGISIIDESMGGGRQRVVDEFRSADKAVLMGASRFWETIDIPDNELKVVAIAKMPFDVPSNPVFAARSETYQPDQFLQYGLPDAILRFRQGFGRLMRRKGDRGVVVVFDRRMVSKRYGRHFVESLPNVSVEKGSRARLRYAVRDWLK
jgi:DNA polymerase-3 subunit epsilon/ATP-dependent DNA helicase DinG